jgi:hypothetical protein
MKILTNMKKTTATIDDIKFGCEFCKREFIRERTLISHLCEQKNRWLSKDQKGNRLAFQCWLQFYAKNSMSKTKNKTYEEFIKNPYYTAFIKFGNYCNDVNVINVSRYVDWLLKENTKIDNWNSDVTYTKFLIEYLKNENPFDALARSVEYCANLGEADNLLPNDLFRYGNANKICYGITTGKISPWMLYQSDSGVHFLDTLSQDHVRIVIDYINPEQWALKFNREPDLARQIKDTLRQAGY